MDSNFQPGDTLHGSTGHRRRSRKRVVTGVRDGRLRYLLDGYPTSAALSAVARWLHTPSCTIRHIPIALMLPDGL